MKWYYIDEDPPKAGQEIYFIRQFKKGRRTVCEGAYGIYKKDGVHLRLGSGAYSSGPCPNDDITCWADRKDFDHDMV